MGGRGQIRQSYWISHRPGNPAEYPDEIATADKILSSGLFPSDFLDNPEIYQHIDPAVLESVEVLRAIQGNPEALVTIYRGSDTGELNKGDWVSLSRIYANDYAGEGFYSGNPNNKVYSYTVKAKELSFDGDSYNEFGYWGKKQKFQN